MICDCGVFQLFANNIYWFCFTNYASSCALGKMDRSLGYANVHISGRIVTIPVQSFWPMPTFKSVCLSLAKVITLLYQHKRMEEGKGMYTLFYLWLS
jgi:hypothetical protein